MKATAGSDSDKAVGFWARLGSALVAIDAAMEMSPVDLLELRIGRLENQVAQLIGGKQRGSANPSPTDDGGLR